MEYIDFNRDSWSPVVELLIEWYRKVRRPLPWRLTRDPYKIWLSEIMLQQTRISAVLDYYARFIKALPDIPALACVDDDALMKLWQGLGYYSRARNLKKAAGILVEQYGGHFPADYTSIRSLPGIGDYTAGAVASIAFGIPVAAVDGNVLRVMTRYLADCQDISKEKTKAYFRSLIGRILPKDNPGELNQALMELGERVCLPSGAPDCANCPLHETCRSCQDGNPERFPVKPAPRPRRIEERTVWIIVNNGRIALRKRTEKGLLSGLWELPNRPTSEADLLPDLQGALNSPSVSVAEGVHVFTHIEWHMRAYRADVSGLILPEGWVWASWDEVEKIYALPNAFRFARDAMKKALT